MILDRRSDGRPIVIIGDIHGAFFTLTESLLPALGFSPDGQHPDNKRLVSVGDLTDRAGVFGVQAGNPEDSGAVKVLRWAMDWTERDALDVTDSNHGKKLAAKLRSGDRLSPTGEPFGHGLDDTLADIDALENSAEFSATVIEFLNSRPYIARYSGGPTGELLVAHAAVNNHTLNAEVSTKRGRDSCIFPREFEWYGPQTVVVGHVVTEGVVRERFTRTDGAPTGEIIRIDTGAFDDGGLTAYFPDSDTSVTVPTDPRDLADEARRERNRFHG